MNSIKTLPREPWRGSMICGRQIAYGGWSHAAAWCAERKAPDAYECQRHWDELIAEGDDLIFAEGNAIGASHWQVRLLWEGDEPDVPVEASAEEMALYAHVFA